MKRSLKSFLCFGVVCGLSALIAGRAAAVQVTLNFVQPESYLTWSGFFAGQPFLAQDGVAGTTDSNPSSPSNKTTYQGTITVDVDNLLAPTSIKIISSAADADLSGSWLPDVQPFIDIDGGGPGDFPGDAVTSVGTVPGPSAVADYGIRVKPPGAPDVAYAAQRDLVFNVTTPGVEAVNGLGEFSSLTQNFEYAQGWFDYWLHPTFTSQKIRQRLELSGGDNDNLSAALSTYTVTPLGGGVNEIKLFIPVNVNDPDDTAPTNYAGQLVATIITPEPTSAVLLSLAGVCGALFNGRNRKK